MDFNEKVKAFAKLVLGEWFDSYKLDLHNGQEQIRIGKYMVVVETGEIFGVKHYGRIDKSHCFGTLDTVYRFEWSGEMPYRKFKKGSSWGENKTAGLTSSRAID